VILYTRAPSDFDTACACELETFIERSPLGRALVWREVMLRGTPEQHAEQLERYKSTGLAVRCNDPRKNK